MHPGASVVLFASVAQPALLEPSLQQPSGSASQPLGSTGVGVAVGVAVGVGLHAHAVESYPAGHAF